jgi:hypothetical protein
MFQFLNNRKVESKMKRLKYSPKILIAAVSLTTAVVLINDTAHPQPQSRVPMPESVGALATTTTRLQCCRCVGDAAATLDLSTGQASPIDQVWFVSNGANAYTTQPNSQWILLTPSNWIQPVASPTPASLGAGTFKYKTQFNIPDCAVSMSVRLNGQFAADNSAKAYFDGSLIASCGSACFLSSGGAPVSFSVPSIGPGLHVLEIDVTNTVSHFGLYTDTGLIVNAHVTGQCARCDRCPYLGAYDGANCYVGHPPPGTTSFIYANNFYYKPLPGNQCPMPGSWFDGANCFVTTIPPQASPFLYNNAWYVHPANCGATPLGRKSK